MEGYAGGRDGREKRALEMNKRNRQGRSGRKGKRGREKRDFLAGPHGSISVASTPSSGTHTQAPLQHTPIAANLMSQRSTPAPRAPRVVIMIQL